MEEEIEKKIKDLKEFIRQKTDQGTANYLGKKIREICGMVETKQLRIHDVVEQSEQLVCDHPEDEQTWMRSGKASYCNKCNELVKAN